MEEKVYFFVCVKLGLKIVTCNSKYSLSVLLEYSIAVLKAE